MGEDPNEYVKLTRAHAEMQAASIVAALVDRGIRARQVGGLVSEFRSEFSAGVDVSVCDGQIMNASGRPFRKSSRNAAGSEGAGGGRA